MGAHRAAPRHATPRYTTPRCHALRHATPRHATPRHATTYPASSQRCITSQILIAGPASLHPRSSLACLALGRLVVWAAPTPPTKPRAVPASPRHLQRPHRFLCPQANLRLSPHRSRHLSLGTHTILHLSRQRCPAPTPRPCPRRSLRSCPPSSPPRCPPSSPRRCPRRSRRLYRVLSPALRRRRSPVLCRHRSRQGHRVLRWDDDHMRAWPLPTGAAPFPL